MERNRVIVERAENFMELKTRKRIKRSIKKRTILETIMKAKVKSYEGTRKTTPKFLKTGQIKGPKMTSKAHLPLHN